MRVPQISDRVKEAPAVALRGLLAGVGQLLLITDKLRNKAGAGEDVPQARTPDPAETAETAGPEAAAAAAPEAAPEPAVTPEAAPPEAVTPEAAPPAEPEPTAEATAAKQPEPATAKRDPNRTGNVRLLTKEDTPEPEPATAPAPASPAGGPAALPNYDELSVASLRARLRNLTAEQVGELAAYEREHAARPEVITMFERRIAKLESGG